MTDEFDPCIEKALAERIERNRPSVPWFSLLLLALMGAASLLPWGTILYRFHGGNAAGQESIPLNAIDAPDQPERKPNKADMFVRGNMWQASLLIIPEGPGLPAVHLWGIALALVLARWRRFRFPRDSFKGGKKRATWSQIAYALCAWSILTCGTSLLAFFLQGSPGSGLALTLLIFLMLGLQLLWDDFRNLDYA